jgi:hypothetical protein
MCCCTPALRPPRGLKRPDAWDRSFARRVEVGLLFFVSDEQGTVLVSMLCEIRARITAVVVGPRDESGGGGDALKLSSEQARRAGAGSEGGKESSVGAGRCASGVTPAKPKGIFRVLCSARCDMSIYVPSRRLLSVEATLQSGVRCCLLQRVREWRRVEDRGGPAMSRLSQPSLISHVGGHPPSIRSGRTSQTPTRCAVEISWLLLRLLLLVGGYHSTGTGCYDEVEARAPLFP